MNTTAMEEDPIPLVSDDDDDDEMAELFSFGIHDAASPDRNPHDPTYAPSSVLSSSSLAAVRSERADSNDSFMELLESTNVFTSSAEPLTTVHDAETQEILKWLNDDDDEAEIVFDDSMGTTIIETETPQVVPMEEEEQQQTQQESEVPVAVTTSTLTETITVQPTVVELPPVFATLAEALQSKQSTISQIRELYAHTPAVETELRPELYARMICNKTVSDIKSSSLAETEVHESSFSIDDESYKYITALAEMRHVNREHLIQVLADKDSFLLAPVASILLSSQIPVSAARVMLTQIVPHTMPVLAMLAEERWHAMIALHTEFYLLACYHVPLLVFHLDQYMPGWHWPKQNEKNINDNNNSTVTDQQQQTATERGRNLEKQGQLPASWLVSCFAGECGSGIVLPVQVVQSVWDHVLTSRDGTWVFFLTLAILEKWADELILLTGPALKEELQNVLRLGKVTSMEDWTQEWHTRARSLQDATPVSVIERLKTAEDDAIQQTIRERQKRAEAQIKARLEAEAAAHKEAQEKKADEARERLNRARLVAFYRKHAPDKEGNIDKIMSTFEGRLDVLDKKLKAKYGEGFNPAIKVKPQTLSKTSNKLLATMNQGLGSTRRLPSAKDENDDDEETFAVDEQKIAVKISAEEVLPVVCWSKENAAARNASHRRNRHIGRKPLKFYLVDSRPEESAAEQGRFPTASTLSPEAMLDPERIQDTEDMFESLRGAVHIVVMGEGFSAIPKLYNQKLDPKLEELMIEDDNRTNMCAFFFVKKGFPFVSVLDGGFAAAHSWLVREGATKNLHAASVLVDYDPQASFFGQMELLHNASTTERAQRAMHNLLEKSLVVMTKRAQQLERLASDLDAKESRQNISLGFFGGKKVDASTEATEETKAGEQGSESKQSGGFQNPFAALGKNKEAKTSDDDKSETTEVKKQASFQIPFTGNSKAKENGPEDHETAEVKAESASGGSIAIPVFRNPFARKDERTVSDSAALAEADSTKPDLPATEEAKVNIGSTPEEVPNTAAEKSGEPDQSSSQPQPNNPFSMLRGSIAKQVATAPEAKPMNNPFKGFGAAFNNTMKQGSSFTNADDKKPAVPNMLKAFARFGGQQEGEPKPSEQKVGFSSLNQLRMSTMARMRATGEESGPTSDEAISFDHQTDNHDPPQPVEPQVGRV